MLVAIGGFFAASVSAPVAVAPVAIGASPAVAECDVLLLLKLLLSLLLLLLLIFYKRTTFFFQDYRSPSDPFARITATTFSSKAAVDRYSRGQFEDDITFEYYNTFITECQYMLTR